MKLKKQPPRTKISLFGERKFRRCRRCGKYIRIGQSYEIIDGRVYHGGRRNCGK